MWVHQRVGGHHQGVSPLDRGRYERPVFSYVRSSWRVAGGFAGRWCMPVARVAHASALGVLPLAVSHLAHAAAQPRGDFEGCAQSRQGSCEAWARTTECGVCGTSLVQIHVLLAPSSLGAHGGECRSGCASRVPQMDPALGPGPPAGVAWLATPWGGGASPSNDGGMPKRCCTNPGMRSRQ